VNAVEITDGRGYLRSRAIAVGRRFLTVLSVLGIAATIFGVTYIVVARATPGLEVAGERPNC
jgi:hypothetical protein